MKTKSLYTILGVRPDASVAEIETAYAEHLHQLQDGATDSDARVRLIAIKEAYTVLSDPIARQYYNQKLFASISGTSAPGLATDSPSSVWSIPKLLIIGSIVIAAIWTYNRNSLEKERLRIEHENQLLAAQTETERKQREEQNRLQQAAMQQQQAYQQETKERAAREQALRESRELDYRLQREAREQANQQQRDAREKQYLQQQEEARQRQLKYEAERQIEREKQALRNLQNENRRNSRYY